MTFRQQQLAVFFGTVVLIFGLFAGGLFLISQRLTQEATLQTALILARQVEIAMADSLRKRASNPNPNPKPESQGSPWSFLGLLFPKAEPPPRPPSPSRRAEVTGLMRTYLARNASIEAMWVVNSEGKVLYASRRDEEGKPLGEPVMRENVKKGVPIVESRRSGNNYYYDVLVPLEMPKGVRGPGGLRLWINPSHWTDFVAGLWRQLTLFFVLSGAVALLSAFVMTALYTRRFRLISAALRQAEAGTYQERPAYASRDEVGASLDLIDRLVMKQRRQEGHPTALQRLAVAARTLAHEVRSPLHALAIHLELLRQSAGARQEPSAGNGERARSWEVLEASVRQVARLVRDFSDYATPIALKREPIDVAEALRASVQAIETPCATQGVKLVQQLPSGPWPVRGDAACLRQAFDNLLRNAMEAQPRGGSIRVAAENDGKTLTLFFSDSGPGVPPERRASLFDFAQSTKPGGSGIGLALSQLIVEGHGGSLEHQDHGARTTGATFRLVLPLDGGAS